MAPVTSAVLWTGWKLINSTVLSLKNQSSSWVFFPQWDENSSRHVCLTVFDGCYCDAMGHFVILEQNLSAVGVIVLMDSVARKMKFPSDLYLSYQWQQAQAIFDWPPNFQWVSIEYLPLEVLLLGVRIPGCPFRYQFFRDASERGWEQGLNDIPNSTSKSYKY